MLVLLAALVGVIVVAVLLGRSVQVLFVNVSRAVNLARRPQRGSAAGEARLQLHPSKYQCRDHGESQRQELEADRLLFTCEVRHALARP